jgi:hypothetical protein
MKYGTRVDTNTTRPSRPCLKARLDAGLIQAAEMRAAALNMPLRTYLSHLVEGTVLQSPLGPGVDSVHAVPPAPRATTEHGKAQLKVLVSDRVRKKAKAQALASNVSMSGYIATLIAHDLGRPDPLMREELQEALLDTA